jgi:hypothetical protein
VGRKRKRPDWGGRPIRAKTYATGYEPKGAALDPKIVSGPAEDAPGKEVNDDGLELRGFEPLTSAVRLQRSPI